jgi:hypothetical protein
VPIKVIVGTETTKTWYLAPALLKSVSGYFRACLDGKFAEAASGEIVLKNDDTIMFEYFVAWLFASRIEGTIHGVGQRLWIFADRIMCEGLQNRAMDKARTSIRVDGQPHIRNPEALLQNLSELYEETTPGSQLRKFWLDMTAYSMTQDTDFSTKLTATEAFATLPDDLTKELFVTHTKYISLGKDAASPAVGPDCAYHTHAGPSCSSFRGRGVNVVMVRDVPLTREGDDTNSDDAAGAKKRKLSEAAVSSPSDPSTPTSTFTGFGGRGSGALRGGTPGGRGGIPRAGSRSLGRGGFVPRGRGG